MRIIGCDLHAAKQTIAMLDRDTGEVVDKTLNHDEETAREFYASIPAPAVVGIGASGSMGWFLRMQFRFGVFLIGIGEFQTMNVVSAEPEQPVVDVGSASGGAAG